MPAALRPTALMLGTLLMLGLQLAAQDPARDAKQLEAALASPEPQAVAWAAHDASVLRDRKLIGPLQRALARWRRDASPDVSLHLLDALVILDAHVPAGDLMPLIDTEPCSVAAFVLLVQEPKLNEAELLGLFRRDWPDAKQGGDSRQERQCLAIGNLLATQAPPGFAGMLAERVDLDLEIVVSSRESEREAAKQRAEVAVRHVNLRAYLRPPMKADIGWPPRPLYQFAHPTLHMTAVEIPLPPPVGIRVFRRSSEDQEEIVPVLTVRAKAAAPADSLRWLCTVAGVPVPATLRRLPPMEPQAFVAAATKARDELQNAVDTLRERLVAARAMTETEAKLLERRVTVVVHDERTDQPVPLPKIPDAR
ncbi:MAG TPA: hypothetical protein VF384_00235 [Planctomycetota bacterium]